MAAEAARYVYVRGERGPPLPAPVLFGRFELAPTQVFYRSEARPGRETGPGGS